MDTNTNINNERQTVNVIANNLTRIDNNVFGTPRYIVPIMYFLDLSEGFSEKAIAKAEKLAKKSGLTKARANSRYKGSYILATYLSPFQIASKLYKFEKEGVMERLV
jgi:hypothetical protein